MNKPRKVWETRQELYDRLLNSVKRIYKTYSEIKSLQAKIRDLIEQRKRTPLSSPDYKRLNRAIVRASAKFDEMKLRFVGGE